MTVDATPEDRAEALLPPRRVPRTGDDSPARSLWRYVWRMGGRHQLALGGLAVAVALLGLAPLELQRRLVDDAITPGDAGLMLLLAGLYAGTILLHRTLKFALGLYQTWLGESAALYTRRHLMEHLCARNAGGAGAEGGQAVNVINAEVDKLGGFVGEGPSRAATNAAMLTGVLAYMLAVEPRIAAFAVLFLVPQTVIAPLIQRRLNRLTERRVAHLRELGDMVAKGDACRGDGLEGQLRRVYANRVRYAAWKFLMKGLLNLMNAAGPLAVLGVGGWLAVQGETTVGVLLAFVTGFDRLAEPVRELMAVYRETARARVQHDMIAGWMRRPARDAPAAAEAALTRP